MRKVIKSALFALFMCLSLVTANSATRFQDHETAAGMNAAKLDGLLMAIVTWLSENYDLPADHNHPDVEFLSTEEIAEIFGAQSEQKVWRTKILNAAKDGTREIVSVYSTRSKTIYLSNTWSGISGAEISVLVHEVTHHLQNVAGTKYPCPAAREKLAYKAQERALGYFGTSLRDEFDIDAMTLLLLTRCNRP